MGRILDRVALRRAVETQAAPAPKTTKAPKAPKSPKAAKSAKSSDPTKTTDAAPSAETTPAPKPERGRRGKTFKVPVYRAWIMVFQANGEAADGLRGEKNCLGLEKPQTDAEISAWFEAEYDGRCAEAKKLHRVAGHRSLYNRGVINKQTGVPARLVGEFVRDEKSGELQEVITARRVVKVAG